MTTTQIVLVPGFWLGAWAWDEVVPHLTAAGYAVTALTLPGLGPDEDPVTVTAQDQADAIVAALDRKADARVLVVHSGAAIPGTLVIDQEPGLVDHVVWVDTAPASDGGAMNPDFDGDLFPLDAAWDDELEQGAMRGLTSEQLKTFRSRALPQPGRLVSEPVHLGDEGRLSVPGTVVATGFPAEQFRAGAEQGVPFLAALTQHTHLDYVDLPTGHWPMWSRPAELAQVIAAVAGAGQPGK